MRLSDLHTGCGDDRGLQVLPGLSLSLKQAQQTRADPEVRHFRRWLL